MSLVRWSPFNDAFGLAEALFENPYGRSAAGPWAPRVDVTETPEEVRLELDLPGVEAKAVEIDVSDSVLTVKGERKDTREVSREGSRRVERVFGRFERSFTLPRTVDQSKIEASYRDGVLTLTIPRREETKPRRIEVAVA